MLCDPCLDINNIPYDRHVKSISFPYSRVCDVIIKIIDTMQGRNDTEYISSLENNDTGGLCTTLNIWKYY